jgi:NAD(P)H-flavin reductase
MGPRCETGRLVKKEWVMEGVFRLVFGGEAGAGAGAAPRAGQFFMLKPLRGSVFLPRPLSVLGWRAGELSFLAAVRGAGTGELCAMNVGEEAQLLGPLGNGFAGFLPAGGGDLALVGGGVGVAPLVFFADELRRGGWGGKLALYAGFKRGVAGLEERVFGGVMGALDALVVVCEEGQARDGRGLVTERFDGEDAAAVFCCGPLPMMRRTAEICRAKGVACCVSMETRMACGMGVCLGCALRTRGGARRCCADGPVFDAGEVFFDA